MAKIMIVDDNVDIVETLKTIMEKMGNRTEIAYNGNEFLKKIKKAKPDLVLLDIMMPGLTTKQILNKLKTMGFDSLKIILVTVLRSSEKEKKRLMKEFNIVDYITKPFEVNDFMERVNKCLHGGKE